MPYSLNYHTYTDIERIFDAAIEGGLPATYALATPRAATAWRARANFFRANFPIAKFTHLVLRIDAAQPEVVIIEARQIGTLTTTSGEIRIEDKPAAQQSEVDEIAAKLGIKF